MVHAGVNFALTLSQVQLHATKSFIKVMRVIFGDIFFPRKITTRPISSESYQQFLKAGLKTTLY